DVSVPSGAEVVLSACETGLSDPGDRAGEYVGLAGGFLRSGASAVVATLWMVGDLPSALLTVRLYENRWRRGLPLAAALAEAHCWLRSSPAAELRQRVRELGVPGDADAEQRWVWDADEHPFSHPFYWSGHVVVGDGSRPAPRLRSTEAIDGASLAAPAAP